MSERESAVTFGSTEKVDEGFVNAVDDDSDGLPVLVVLVVLVVFVVGVVFVARLVRANFNVLDSSGLANRP